MRQIPTFIITTVAIGLIGTASALSEPAVKKRHAVGTVHKSYHYRTSHAVRHCPSGVWMNARGEEVKWDTGFVIIEHAVAQRLFLPLAISGRAQVERVFGGVGRGLGRRPRDNYE